ncbi:MAG: succinic semialdehyde dehydrogenase [Bacteroidota bacterium]
MQVQDPVLAEALTTRPSTAGTEPVLPPHLSADRLHSLAANATLRGGEHEALTVTAPFTGEPVGEILLATAGDVAYAAERARSAQAAWAARPVAERAQVLVRFHDLLLERQAEGLDLVQLEGGKCRYDAFVEYFALAKTARYYGYHGADYLRAETRTGFLPLLTQAEVHYPPKGLVGNIAPWNFPILLVIGDVLPALLAGNAVVVKPSELTPFSALWGAQLLYEAGLPPEVFHVVPGRGEAVGPALIDAVDYVHFTGSTRVGQIVAEQAGAGLKGLSLELGGKNPVIVRHDADLGKAVQGIREACFVGSGQTCISAERVYVHESIFDDFTARLAAATEAMLVGAGYDFRAHMGSLISQDQLRRVEAHVDDAVAKGAAVVAGGRALPEAGPFFYAPTLLTGVTEGMTLYREETFGPVAALYPFSTDEEAVAHANDSAYGLNASVWTRDLSAGHRIAEQIACGTVGINDGYAAVWSSTDAPMGGMKQSGLGRRHGREGILKFTEAQTIVTQRLAPLTPSAFGLPMSAFAGVVDTAFRLIRHLPGLR